MTRRHRAGPSEPAPVAINKVCAGRRTAYRSTWGWKLQGRSLGTASADQEWPFGRLPRSRAGVRPVSSLRRGPRLPNPCLLSLTLLDRGLLRARRPPSAADGCLLPLL